MSKPTLDDVTIVMTNGATVTCSPKSAVYILRGLNLKPAEDAEPR